MRNQTNLSDLMPETNEKPAEHDQRPVEMFAYEYGQLKKYVIPTVHCPFQWAELVSCQLQNEGIVFFCRLGRAKRNPTRIVYVHHVGFRFALPNLQYST